MHVASPFPIAADETIVDIAVRGTLNVLEACADINCSVVKKVVLTSSCAAINGNLEGGIDGIVSYFFCISKSNYYTT